MREIIANSELEMEKINAMYLKENFSLESVCKDLLLLRSQNPEEASFENKSELMRV